MTREPIADPFGGGEFPASLDRFNWGAFFLPGIWGLVYGTLPLIALWLGTLMLPILLLGIVGTAEWRLVVAASVTTEVFAGCVRLWAGVSGNRLAWQRRRLLAERAEIAPRFGIARFESRQRVWAIVGAVLSVLTLGMLALGILAVQAGVVPAAELPIRWVDLVEASVWLGAEVVLGVWLAGKMRQEVTPTEPTERAF